MKSERLNLSIQNAQADVVSSFCFVDVLKRDYTAVASTVRRKLNRNLTVCRYSGWCKHPIKR